MSLVFKIEIVLFLTLGNRVCLCYIFTEERRGRNEIELYTNGMICFLGSYLLSLKAG